jgi:hypothetical protein
MRHHVPDELIRKEEWTALQIRTVNAARLRSELIV